MKPQELKKSILQLAIQGKLVEQRPEEGTAEELYRQIQQEKQTLIKAGKIKRDKRLEDLYIESESVPFDIPESWKWVCLGGILNKLTDGTHKTPKYTNEGVKFVSVKDMSNGILSLIDTKYISVTEHEELFTRCDPQRGDMLLSKVGTTGVPAIIDTDEPFSLFVSVALLKYSHHCIDERYLYYLLQSPLVQLQAKENTRGVGNKNWVLDAIAKTYVVLPPFAEQKRIVAKIEELLPYIDRYEKAWNRLEDFNKRFPADMQKSILQLAIQGKLVEQRPEEGTGEALYQQIQKEKQALIKTGELKKTKALPEITEDIYPYEFPSSWKICYIDDIAFVTKLAGFEYTEYIAPNIKSEGIPLFKGKNVQNGKVILNFESFIPQSISDELPRSQIRKKCLLTPYVGTIGNIAIFDGNFRAHLGSNVGKIELLNGKEQYILEEYVLYYMRSQYGYAELTKFKKATAQESISIDAIRNVIIPLPPLAEQKRIVPKLEELLPMCEKMKGIE